MIKDIFSCCNPKKDHHEIDIFSLQNVSNGNDSHQNHLNNFDLPDLIYDNSRIIILNRDLDREDVRASNPIRIENTSLFERFPSANVNLNVENSINNAVEAAQHLASIPLSDKFCKIENVIRKGGWPDWFSKHDVSVLDLDFSAIERVSNFFVEIGNSLCDILMTPNPALFMNLLITIERCIDLMETSNQSFKFIFTSDLPTLGLDFRVVCLENPVHNSLDISDWQSVNRGITIEEGMWDERMHLIFTPGQTSAAFDLVINDNIVSFNRVKHSSHDVPRSIPLEFRRP